MMVVNSFDLWQKDAFFSAAEEVQESADVMESAYRLWIKEGQKASLPAQLSRELQTTLGTAKWQLEEFERAIRLSYGHHCDDSRATRHTQFIGAIESQIRRVEAALKEAFIDQGKRPLRWVDLNKEECDDLAMFLSGKGVDATSNGNSPEVKHFNDSGKGLECLINVEDENSSWKTDDVCSGQNRTRSSPKIVVADENEDKRSGMEATAKEKGSKPFFLKQRRGVHLQFRVSLQLKLALMIAIFLIVPFLLYSS